ncbi:hypothetical protein JW905_10060, partial [bacterium]|nr:hypothetical protein [candidate division CSSED10-310 bacterium]
LERHRRAPGDLDIPAMIARASAQARDSLRARLPRGGSMPVVMESDALEYVFDPFITHAGGALQYRGLSRFHPGEPVIPARRGEPIFLASDGLLVHGNNSLPFDEDGVPAHRIAVVEDGRFLSPVCDQEHSQYLGVRATGPFANKVLGSGPRSLSELVGDGGPLLHVVAFSSCIPDNLTGDFVGEIRLAYEHRDGAVIPVKGGAVSGNVFNAFADAHFSAEREFRGDYLGPRAVRLGPLTVVGV